METWVLIFVLFGEPHLMGEYQTEVLCKVAGHNQLRHWRALDKNTIWACVQSEDVVKDLHHG